MSVSSTLTDQFIDVLYALSREPCPDAIVRAARGRMLDYLGVALAGAAMQRERGLRLLDALGPASQEATAIGLGRKTSLPNSILVNGIHAHAAELDDGERRAMMHPGAPVLSALLPLAECRPMPDAKLLRGIVMGYEAAIRVAGALQPGMKERGYHATGTCGTIGAAVAIAVALDFSRDELKAALAAAATAASGLLGVIRDISDLKPFNAGHAALNGWYAAMVARAGFAGPREVLAGPEGFLSVMAAACNEDRLLGGAAPGYAIERVYMKPYAACRHCHPAIEAALALRRGHGLSPDAIREVRVSTYRWAVHLHDHAEVEGEASAKMSTPYSVAVALGTGRAGMAEFAPPHVKDPQILALARKVRVVEDPALTALVPAARPAVVEIHTEAGASHRVRVDLPKGEPENPVTDGELVEKFSGLARYAGKTQPDVDALVKAIQAGDDLAGILKRV